MCYCDNSIYTYSFGNPGDSDYSTSGVKVDKSFCNTPCAANTAEECGGTGYPSFAKAYDPNSGPTCKKFRSLERRGKTLLRRHFHFMRRYPSVMDRWYKLEEESTRLKFRFHTSPQAPIWRARTKRMEEHVEYAYELHSRASQALWGMPEVFMGNITSA